MLWAALAFLHSIFRAIVTETGRSYRQDEWHLAFWQAVWAVLFLLPFWPLMDWPGNARFYLSAVVVALIFSVGQVVRLNMADARIGRVTALAVPLEAFLAFVIWLFVLPPARHDFAAHPAQALMAAVCFAAVSAALVFLRRHDIGWRTAAIVVPVGFSYAVAGVAMKLAIPAGLFAAAALPFLLVHYAASAVVMGLTLVLKGKARGLRRRETALAGGMTGLFALAAWFSFTLGVVAAPNPGYVSFAAVLVPVWLMWYREMRLEDDRSNPAAALVVVAGVLVFIGLMVFL